MPLASGRAIALGGIEGLQPSGIVDVFGSDKSWTRGPDIPTARAGTSIVATADGRVLVIGGGPTLVLDAPLAHWTTIAAPFSTTSPAAATLDDGHVLVAGGYDPKGNRCLTTAAWLDPKTNVWETLPPLPEPHGLGVLFATSDGKALLFGGCDDGEVVGTRISVRVFDRTTKTWTKAPSGPTVRRDAEFTRLRDGTVLLSGGWPRDLSMDKSEGLQMAQFSLAAGWRTGPALRAPRLNHAAAVLRDGRVLLIGGSAPGVPALSTVEVFDPNKTSVTDGPALPVAMTKPAAASLDDGAVLVTGGLAQAPTRNIREVYVLHE